MEQDNQHSPTLYLMPSTMSDASRPDDVLPERNRQVALSVRHYIVENVRTARRFLRRWCGRDIDIYSLTFYTLDEHTRPGELHEMLEPLAAGHDMAVISEAGCPAVADPGADVVAVAQQRGVKVVPLVGPSSILMSLMASGFNGQSFAFVGYLPVDAHRRAACLRQMARRIANEGQTQIFIETPYRNNRLIADIVRALPGELKLCVARDITGPEESIVTLTLEQWRSRDYDYGKIPMIFLLYK